MERSPLRISCPSQRNPTSPPSQSCLNIRVFCAVFFLLIMRRLIRGLRARYRYFMLASISVFIFLLSYGEVHAVKHPPQIVLYIVKGTKAPRSEGVKCYCLQLLWSFPAVFGPAQGTRFSFFFFFLHYE